MTLTVHAFGAYLTVMSGGRTREEIQMSSIVKIIKKDVAALRVADMTDLDGMPVRLKDCNRDDVLRMFGKWGARRLQSIGAAGGIIVGVPGSSHTSASANFTAGRMANAVAQFGGGHANPILYFKEAMKPAHQGNKRARDTTYLEDMLVCTEERLTGPVVIVDDVVTTGAHMIASARKLRALGATVAIGLCAARSVKEGVANPFDVPPIDFAT